MRAKILVTTTYISFIVFILSLCLLDSQSILPDIIGIISGTYLILRAQAEGLFEDRRHRKGM